MAVIIMEKRKSSDRDNGKMKRKLYEKELRKLPGQALPFAGMGESQGTEDHHSF